jgi:hypothetical protein
MSPVGYITPLVKSGSIKFAVYSNFVSLTGKSLIVAKGSYLDIYNVFNDGLSLVESVYVGGPLTSLVAFTPRRGLNAGLVPQNLFYSLLDGSVHVVRYHNGLQFFHGKPGGGGRIIKACVDPGNTVIALASENGIVRLFFLSCRRARLRTNNEIDLELQEVFSKVVVEDIFAIAGVTNILDVCFMGSSTNCMFVTLSRSSDIETTVTMLAVNRLAMSRALSLKSNKIVHVIGSNRIHPVADPYGGILEFGETTVFYHRKSGQPLTAELPEMAVVEACVQIDSARYLMGTSEGKLYVVLIWPDSLQVESVGTTVPPTQLIHFGAEYFMATSHYSSSTMFRLDIHKRQTTMIYQLENLGPIVDFYVTSSNEVMACTGGFGGSVKKLKSGIVPIESYELDIQDVQGFWCYKDTRKKTLLVASCIGQTRLFALSGSQEFEELFSWRSMQLDKETVGFGSCGPAVVHITSELAYLIDGDESWSPPGPISRALILDDNKILCAVSDTLYLLDQQLSVICTVQFDIDYEISAIAAVDDCVLVSFWHSSELRILRVTTGGAFTALCSHRLASSAPPRSLVLKQTDDKLSAIIGLADGMVLSYLIDVNQEEVYRFVESGALSIGSKPVSLFQLDQWLFSCSDFLGLALTDDLDFHLVNWPSPRSIACISEGEFAFVSDKSVHVVRMGRVSALHIEETSFENSWTTRLAQISDGWAAVLTYGSVLENSGNDSVKNASCSPQTIRIIDENGMKEICQRELPKGYFATALLSMGKGRLVVGGEILPTGPPFDEEVWEAESITDSVAVNGITESKRGEVICLTWEDGELCAMNPLAVPGAVHALCRVSDTKFAAGVQSMVSF